MKISIYPPLSIHEIGQRANQEDSIAQWDNRLFVLCDGMGGHEKGEVASQTVCQSLVKWFEQNIKDDSFADDQLREALEYAYTELDKFDDGSPRKMGTTLTLLYIHSKGVTAAHIGDSRIYHIRVSSPMGGGQEGAILYQSRDHSLVFDLFQAGEITYDEMATYPQKNIVTRAMTPGKDNRMRPDIIHITDILPDDYFFLCSDGMLEQMGNDELAGLISSDASDEEKRNQLIAETADNQDNHSAWLIHIKDIVHEEDDETLVNEEPTARCNAININPKVIEAHEDDDVVIVSQSPIKRKKKDKWIRIGILVLAIITILTIACVFFLIREEKPKLQRPKPMMLTPIKSRFNNDTTIKDTNQIRQNDSTGNQHKFNAPRGNHSPRDVQNR